MRVNKSERPSDDAMRRDATNPPINKDALASPSKLLETGLGEKKPIVSSAKAARKGANERTYTHRHTGHNFTVLRIDRRRQASDAYSLLRAREKSDREGDIYIYVCMPKHSASRVAPATDDNNP